MPMLSWAGKAKVVNHHNDVPFRVLERKWIFNAGTQSRREMDELLSLRGVSESRSSEGNSNNSFCLQNSKTPRSESNNGSGENMIIHGDNLAALKALLPRYEGKVKCIYIDPPYNTGNEGWVYNDNVNDPQIKKWLGEVVGKEGEDFSRHDKWLCMMYPRLRLLQKLMTEDGIIFISIDDNEQANLRLICDEIFGSDKFVGTIAWESKTKCQNTKTARRQFQRKWEYILVYKAKSGRYEFLLDEVAEHKYDHEDDVGCYRVHKVEEMSARGTRGRQTMVFPILGIMPRIGYQWKVGKDSIELFEERGDVFVEDNHPYLKLRPDDEENICSPFWSLIDKSHGTGESAKKELGQIIGANDFETVKPHELIEYLIARVCKKDEGAIILDSFAGSGSTGHAVLKMNNDGGNRKFILIEMMDYADTLTAERIKRVITGYDYKSKKGLIHVAGLGGSFGYYELGEPLMIGENLNESLPVEKIREYVWYMETRGTGNVANVEMLPMPTANFQLENGNNGIPNTGNLGNNNKDPYLLGVAGGTAYYFCYEKGNVVKLNRALLKKLKTKAESYVIYADICLLDKEELARYNIVFKKIPRDIAKL